MLRQKIQLEIEREALKKEESTESQAKVQDLTKQINELEEKVSKMKIQWEQEKSSIIGEAAIKEEIDKVKNKIEEAERNTDLQLAAELKYGKLLELEKQLKAWKSQWKIDLIKTINPEFKDLSEEIDS